ncbi:MAG: response regulator, partial [Psychrobacillus psychrodurans]
MNQLTVLVTDDDQDIRDGIEIYLKNEGYRVLKAADGLEAIKLLEQNEVHCIILDIMMPNMDGITATFKIR